jgi:hypothetical protein
VVSPYLEILSQDTKILSDLSITMISESRNLAGSVVMGNETTSGQLSILNGDRSDLLETISANGITGELSSGRSIDVHHSFHYVDLNLLYLAFPSEFD